jgi:hypothetical protein
MIQCDARPSPDDGFTARRKTNLNFRRWRARVKLICAGASGKTGFWANANYFLHFLKFFCLRKIAGLPILKPVEGAAIKRFVLWKMEKNW